MSEANLFNIKQVVLKSRVYILSSIIIGFIAVVSVMLLNKPIAVYDGYEVLTKETQLATSERLNEALKKLVIQQQETLYELVRKDSILSNRIQKNSEAINKLDFSKIHATFNRSKKLLNKTKHF